MENRSAGGAIQTRAVKGEARSGVGSDAGTGAEDVCSPWLERASSC